MYYNVRFWCFRPCTAKLNFTKNQACDLKYLTPNDHMIFVIHDSKLQKYIVTKSRSTVFMPHRR